MSHFALLVALDVNNLISIALVILFIVVPAVLKLLGKDGQPKRPAPGKRPPARPPARPAEGGVEDEIGDFLRQAARRRGGRQQPPAEKPVMAEIGGRQIVEAEAVHEVPAGQQVRQHVSEHLDAGEFSRRTSQLGGEVAQADEQVEERIHQAFDHKLGNLASEFAESAAAPLAEEPATRLPATAAAGLPALFSNAQSIRQAIVINEILQRPEHRWT